MDKLTPSQQNVILDAFLQIHKLYIRHHLISDKMKPCSDAAAYVYYKTMSVLADTYEARQEYEVKANDFFERVKEQSDFKIQETN